MRWFWLDRFTEFVSGSRATALKCVSLSEDYLHDHWPDYPLMPNSLVAEGMAQTGGLLVSEVYKFGELVVLAKFAKCSFEGEVRPGDTLRYDAQILQAKDAGASVHVTAHVGDQQRAEDLSELAGVHARTLAALKMLRDNSSAPRVVQ